MGNPYETVAITGYNDNPPPDDGSESEENRVLWETIKEKLPDPLKTAIEAIDANLLVAFAKVLGGAGTVTSAISATVGASDQGKLYRATAGGVTITTPDATSVTSPFWFALLNSGTTPITLDGNGAQTVNGVASIIIPVGGGGIVSTDGSNWFITGLGGVLAGKQLMYGDIINGTIAESNATNAATYALKTLAGADPSTDDPVLICFRNATAATGNYVYRTVTAALSVVIPSGATLGAVNATPFDVVVALFDDGGTIRLGVINPFQASDFSLYELAQAPPIASSTTIGTGSDSAKVWYTGTGVTSKPYVVLALARYTAGPGLTTAGSWNASPTTLQPYGHGQPLPGMELRKLLHVRDEKASGTAGGTSTASWGTRTLNTTKTNEITGASLGSNQITLPAGTYEIEGAGGYRQADKSQIRFRNVTDGTTAVVGQNCTTVQTSVANPGGMAMIRGRFSIPSQKVFEFQQQASSAVATDGWGQANSFGEVEVYAEVIITKIG